MSKSVRKLSVLVLAFFAFVALSLGAFVFQAKADVTTSDLITIASAAEVRLDDAEKEGDNTGIRFVITAQKSASRAIIRSVPSSSRVLQTMSKCQERQR